MRYPVYDSLSLSEMLVSARKRLGLSQRQLAERLGMQQQNYARMEKNPGSVALDTMLAIFVVLGLGMVLDELPDTGRQAAMGLSVKRRINTQKGSRARSETQPEKVTRVEEQKTGYQPLPAGSIWGDEPPEDF
ncbi:transcriptional regulator with XRE-family HTH domain [Silvimonas terrae]|uniref:Transcriptional regulator with XRE-family HTH domain n=1 Tax=Silvimonas terrae TaxID=300266 RepID=A0A840R9U5_9NEIS|nr:helix-turn-helix transcriptional regulator [Silvimonas terrae]MBB5190125.1 transcriptional regulator with XRE-family HTH domain [Silvimonas terrae]